MARHQRFLTLRLLGLVVLLWLVLLPGRAAAAPAEVRVGLHLLDIGSFDIASGSYTADFYLILRCETTPCEPDTFEVMNGSIDAIDEQRDRPTEKILRVQATLNENLYLHDYPFDKHVLRIRIEDRLKDITRQVYVADPAVIAEDVEVVGWLHSDQGRTMIVEHPYPLFDQVYSAYIFELDISRPILAAILKGLFPAVVLVLTGFLALIMGPDKALQRLEVTTAALVGTVLFHLNLTSSLPSVPYLTWADQFMMINYGILGIALAGTVVLVRLEERKQLDVAFRIHRTFGPLIPSLWVTAQTVNLILFLPRIQIPGLWALVPVLLHLLQVGYLLRTYRAARTRDRYQLSTGTR